MFSFSRLGRSSGFFLPLMVFEVYRQVWVAAIVLQGFCRGLRGSQRFRLAASFLRLTGWNLAFTNPRNET
jgi:hypothetical protein